MAEFLHIKKQFWCRHLWARGSFCCSSGNVTDEVIAKYIADQNVDREEDFRVDGGDHLLLEAHLVIEPRRGYRRSHPAARMRDDWAYLSILGNASMLR
jgi:hypothetical protein